MVDERQCDRSAIRACGRSSFPECARARSTSSASSVPTGCGEKRLTRWPAWPRCRPRPAASSSNQTSSGATMRSSPSAPRRIHSNRKCRSTRFTSPRGAPSPPTGISPNPSLSTSRVWATRTSSSFRSLNTPSAARGVTRSRATTRPPHASVTPTISATSSTLCTRQESGSSWTGFPLTSRRTSGRSDASMAPRSTNTPIHARVSTPIGAPTFSTSAAPKCATSSLPTRATGSKNSTLTVCASTPSRRCSTSTIRETRASGSRTNTVGERTSKRLIFSRRSMPPRISVPRASR